MASSEVAVRNNGGGVARPGAPVNITFENAQIIFRNFEGKEGQYNREGDRNFCLLLDEKTAAQMKADGWNIKELRAREPDETPQSYVQVAVSYKIRPPKVVLITSKGRTTIPEDMLMVLDWAEVANVDLIINPSAWAVNGKTGIKAYLKSIYFTQAEDELELKYADVPEINGPESSKSILELQATPNDGEDDDTIYAELVEDDEEG